MFLSLVLSALVSLLVFFFERWWTANHPINPAAAKQAFLAEVGSAKHFWMGKRRHELAGKIFDKFVARFNADPPKMATGTVLTESEASALAQKYAAGLTLTPNELAKGRLGAGEKQFNVLPNGLVQGGTAAYSLDAASGTIAYRAAIKVGKWFLSKTYETNGAYKVDPTLLNPTNLTVGKVLQIGDLQMRVQSLGQNTAMVALTVGGALKGTGTAILLTNQPVVALNAVDAAVSAYGMSLVLALRPA